MSALIKRFSRLGIRSSVCAWIYFKVKGTLHINIFSIIYNRIIAYIYLHDSYDYVSKVSTYYHCSR